MPLALTTRRPAIEGKDDMVVQSEEGKKGKMVVLLLPSGVWPLCLGIRQECKKIAIGAKLGRTTLDACE